MKNNQKPIQKFGLNINAPEFGELYHIVAAAILCRSYKNIAVATNEKHPISGAQAAFCWFAGVSNALKKQNDYLATRKEATKLVTEAFKTASDKSNKGIVSEQQKKLYKTLRKNMFGRGCLNQDQNQKQTIEQQFCEYIKALWPGFSESDNGGGRSVVIHCRNSKNGAGRNMDRAKLTQIIERLVEQDVVNIILTGDYQSESEQSNLVSDFYPKDPPSNVNIINFGQFFKGNEFQTLCMDLGEYNGHANSYAGQLLFHWVLKTKFNVKAVIGMMSGALDGPAFCGINTFFFCRKNDNRMIEAAEHIPTLNAIVYENEGEGFDASMDEDWLRLNN